jgi:hypothetical protein
LRRNAEDSIPPSTSSRTYVRSSKFLSSSDIRKAEKGSIPAFLPRRNKNGKSSETFQITFV